MNVGNTARVPVVALSGSGTDLSTWKWKICIPVVTNSSGTMQLIGGGLDTKTKLSIAHPIAAWSYILKQPTVSSVGSYMTCTFRKKGATQDTSYHVSGRVKAAPAKSSSYNPVSMVNSYNTSVLEVPTVLEDLSDQNSNSWFASSKWSAAPCIIRLPLAKWENRIAALYGTSAYCATTIEAFTTAGDLNVWYYEKYSSPGGGDTTGKYFNATRADGSNYPQCILSDVEFIRNASTSTTFAHEADVCMTVPYNAAKVPSFTNIKFTVYAFDSNPG